MSLVNDALRKARAEAAREARRADPRLPLLERSQGRHGSPRWTPATRTLLTLGAAALGAVLLGALLIRAVAPEETSPPTEARSAERASGDDGSARTVDSPGPSASLADRTSEDPTTGAGAATQPTTELQNDGSARVAVLPEQVVAPPRRETAPSEAVAERASRASSPGASSPSTPPQRAADEAPSDPAPKQQPVRPATEMADRTAAGSTGARRSQESAEAISESDAPGDEPAASAAQASYVREAEIAGVGSFRLDGIAWSSDQPFALVNGEVVGRGGYVAGVSVAEIMPDRVVLSSDNRRFVIRLR